MTRIARPGSSPIRSALGRLLWLGVLGLTAATLFSLVGRVHWFFELFTHFPIQIAAGLCALVAVALLLRHRWACALATLCLLPQLAALAYYFPASDFPSATPELRTLSFNVLTQNDSYEEVLAYLRESDADIMFLMETNPTWVANLAPLESEYPHSIRAPRNDNFGMVLYSRHPIESQDLRLGDGSRVPLVHATLNVEGRLVEVIGGHPIPPVGARQAASRNAYLAELTTLAMNTRHPTIVLGDFNATVWSPYLREFLEKSGLHDTGRQRGFQSSWRRLNPFFSIPIDHVFHNDRLLCVDRQIGPAMGSDHRPVIVEFAIAK